MKYPTLSVCMIVKDEEKNLPRALASVRGLADEIIVVDTGSKDRTVEVAKSFGAKVYFFEWCDDFSAARNESLRHATKDYILWLDADDEFDARRHKELKAALSKYRGYAFYLVVKLLTPVETEECLQLRVFPRKRDISFEGRIHEQVFPSLLRSKVPMMSLDISITHYGYTDGPSVMSKLERNKKLLEEELAKNPRDLTAKTFYARTLVGLGKRDESLRILKEIIDDMDTDEGFMASNFSKIAFVDLLSSLASCEMVADMERYVLEYKKRFGDDFVSDFTLGTIYLYREDYEKALKYLRAAEGKGFKLNALPFSVPVVYAKLYSKMAFCLGKLGKIRESKRYADLALKIDTEDLEVRDLLADTFIVLKDTASLSLLLERGEKESGRDCYVKGAYHLMMGEFAEAIDSLRMAIDKGYKAKNCYLCLLISYKRVGSLEQAVKLIEEFLREHGNDDEMLRELCMVYLETEQPVEALQVLSKIEQKSRLEATAAMAYCSLLGGNFEGMLRHLAELHGMLFGSKPLSAESVFQLPSVLRQRGESGASQIVSKTLRRLSALSKF